MEDGDSLCRRTLSCVTAQTSPSEDLPARAMCLQCRRTHLLYFCGFMRGVSLCEWLLCESVRLCVLQECAYFKNVKCAWLAGHLLYGVTGACVFYGRDRLKRIVTMIQCRRILGLFFCLLDHRLQREWSMQRAASHHHRDGTFRAICSRYSIVSAKKSDYLRTGLCWLMS